VIIVIENDLTSIYGICCIHNSQIKKKKDEREKKEKKAEESLKLSSTREITEDAVLAEREEKNKLEKLLKETMKKRVRAPPTEMDTTYDKGKSSVVIDGAKNNKGQKRKSKDKVSQKANPATKVARPKVVAEPKGTRKIPTPCDDNGCIHMGCGELMPLPKVYLKAYVKVGGWLYQKPCRDCKQKENAADEKDKIEDGRVLILADLLSSKEVKSALQIAWYCNYGARAHGLDEGDEFKSKFACDMVLCVGCYDNRVRINTSGDKDEGTVTRRSRRGRV
jgi:hypothetical protein